MAADESPLSDTLVHALEVLTELLPAHHASYALIGGLAVGARGRRRYTDDIDLLLTVPQLQLPGLLEALAEHGFSCDIIPTVRAWIQEHMVVMNYRGARVDWLKPVVPIYQHVLDTATTTSWLGHDIRIATAEGLILLKLVAGRTQDFADIESLLAFNRAKLDLEWIEREWLTVFATDDPRWQRFRQAEAEYYQPKTTGE